MFASAIIRSRVLPFAANSIRPVQLSATRRVLVSAYHSSANRVHTAPVSGMSGNERSFRIILGSAALAGVVGLMAAGNAMEEKTSQWQDYVSKRVSSTYGHLFTGLGLTAAAAYGLFQSPAFLRTIANHPTAFSLGTLALSIGSMVAVRSIPEENVLAKYGVWALFNGAIGASLAPVFFMSGPVVLRAAVYTGAVVGGLSLVAMTAKSDQFLSWGTPLAAGLGIVFITSLGRVFLPAHYFIAHSMMENVVVYGGMVVFSGLVLYDTQAIVQRAKFNAKFDPISESIHIYLDAINLFQIILSRLSNRRK